MTEIPLRELEGEVCDILWGDDVTSRCVRFLCPVCLRANGGDPAGVHSQVVPFFVGQRAHGRHPKIGNVWGHESGSTADDITVSPSYLATAAGCCRVHVFIRRGVVQLLADSVQL